MALQRLQEPMTELSTLSGLVVIDEVQRRPDLFPVLRVLVDRRPSRARFLILGSAAPGLLRQSAESLAGRVEFVRMAGFAVADVGARRLARHWLRGGFPRSFLARSEADSLAWRREFVSTFLERDVPQLAASVPSSATTLYPLLANARPLPWRRVEGDGLRGIAWAWTRRRCGATSTPSRTCLMLRQLQPWHQNVDKRQVKAPKVYLRDSGLLHHLLGGVTSEDDLLSHPKCGASWEGYAIEEVLKAVEPDEAYFWAVHSGPELDLMLLKDGRRVGVEIKRADAPKLEASMRAALEILKLDRLLVLYPGSARYSLSDSVTVVPMLSLTQPSRTLDW